MIVGKSGEKNIHQRVNGSWIVRICRNNIVVFNKTFKTLELAINMRDDFIQQLSSKPLLGCRSVPDGLDANKALAFQKC